MVGGDPVIYSRFPWTSYFLLVELLFSFLLTFLKSAKLHNMVLTYWAQHWLLRLFVHLQYIKKIYPSWRKLKCPYFCKRLKIQFILYRGYRNDWRNNLNLFKTTQQSTSKLNFVWKICKSFDKPSVDNCKVNNSYALRTPPLLGRRIFRLPLYFVLCH